MSTPGLFYFLTGCSVSPLPHLSCSCKCMIKSRRKLKWLKKNSYFAKLFFSGISSPRWFSMQLHKCVLNKKIWHWGSENKQLRCGAGWDCFPQQHCQLKEFIRLQLNDKNWVTHLYHQHLSLWKTPQKQQVGSTFDIMQKASYNKVMRVFTVQVILPGRKQIDGSSNGFSHKTVHLMGRAH